MTYQLEYDRFVGLRRFANLDGLRCISILTVLWHHGSQKFGIDSDAFFLERGYLGVYLFFAISGFLITSLLIRERASIGDISLKRFYIRRTLRIFPLYYTVILVYVLLVLIFEPNTEDGQEFFDNLIYFLTYTSNWFVQLGYDERVIFFMAWSLAAEEQFYLMWPWLEKYTRARTRALILASVTLIALIAQVGLLVWLISEDGFIMVVLTELAPPILMGVAAAHVVHHQQSFNRVFSLLKSRMAAPLLLLAIIVLTSIPDMTVLLHWLVYFLMVCLVAAVCVQEENLLAAPLQNGLIVRIGVVSYCAYLIHMICFNVVYRVAEMLSIENPWLLFSIGCCMTYLLSELSFATFEKFFMNLRPMMYRWLAPDGRVVREPQTENDRL
ncbi:MAG: acyltransferase [Pseudomonadota bacterium]